MALNNKKTDKEKEKKIPEKPKKHTPVKTDTEHLKHFQEELTGPIAKIDWLIRRGLAGPEGFDHITWYRMVMAHPDSAIKNPMLRPYIAQILERVMTLILNDVQLYNRLKVILDHEQMAHARMEDAETLNRMQKVLFGG